MIHTKYRKIPNLLTLHISSNQGNFSPLYPGTLFPACPGGGVLELPNPMQDAVIGDPVSGETSNIYDLIFQKMNYCSHFLWTFKMICICGHNP